jgi:pSer/pThr/pTyr-binding forkhead associated (FHA) protein
MRLSVPFTLKVSKGAGAGAEFPFEAHEARLGRTADNDIVVKDAGASRSHARVYQKGSRYFVEDLKSANGTKVNNAVITGSRELKNGDTISIGDVVFTFSFADETILKPPSEELNINETVLRPPPTDTGDITGETGDNTSENPALDPNETVLKPPKHGADPEKERRTTRKSPVSDSETMPPSRAMLKKLKDDGETVPPSRALAKKAAEDLQPALDGTAELKVPPALVRRGGGRAEDDGDADELTAADKLRMRRQAQKTAMGKLTFAFRQLPRPAQIATLAVSALFVLGIVGLVVVTLMPKKKAAAGPEPGEISGGAPTIEQSFGLGDDVTFERPDMKIFAFTAAAATRIVGVLHYQAKDVSKDEVAVSVNGFDLGFVPPDTLDTANRELELVIPAQQIKKGEPNQLTFDNTRNPPGEDPWRVWNLWLELIAIPDMSQEELITAVKEDFDRSQKFYDQRDIGPDNLFKAWKGYRDAWLKMESMTNRPDELYIVARQQQREIAQMLDKRCSMMVLDFQKAMNAKKPDRKRGRQVAEDMLRYFPSREHRCHGLGRDLMEELGGL